MDSDTTIVKGNSIRCNIPRKQIKEFEYFGLDWVYLEIQWKLATEKLSGTF